MMKLMERFRRYFQTRTEGTGEPAAPSVRRNGTAAAYRRAAALFLMTQLLLWVSLNGTMQAGRTLWQSALLLMPAGAGVWWISRLAWAGRAVTEPGKKARKWKNSSDSHAKRQGHSGWLYGLLRLPGLLSASASRRKQRSKAAPHPRTKDPSRPGQSPSRPWETLLLLPCVLADAICILHALLAILTRLMPSYPAGILRVCIPVLLLLGVLLGRRNGTAFGVSLWRWLLPLLAVWVLTHVLRDQGTEQLYPLCDWKATGAAWVTGLGSLWGAGLVFLLPECSGASDPGSGTPPRTVQYVLLPLLLCCLCALGLSVSGAWRVSGEPVGYRLLFAGRTSGSMMISGLWALFWLLSLMTAFATSLMLGQKLLHPLFPRWKGWLPPLLIWLPAVCLLWLEALPVWLVQLLPYRLALWAGAAGWALWRKNRRSRKGSGQKRGLRS